MKRVMLGMLFVIMMVVFLPSGHGVNAEEDMEKYYHVFDKLYVKDYYENQDILVVDTINDGNETIELDGIEYDKKVFYSTLYVQNKENKIKDKIKQEKDKDKDKNYQNMDNLDYLLDLYNEGEINYKNIIDFIQDKEMLKEYKQFFKDLIPKDMIEDDRLITTQTTYYYQWVSLSYLEDFTSTNTVVSFYHKYLEYYIDSNDDLIYTGNVKYVQTSVGGVNPTYYQHQSTTTFTYDSYDNMFSEGSPEVEYTIIVDYLGYQKMIIENTDTNYNAEPFKISQDSHYNRNQYNCIGTNPCTNVTNYQYSELINLDFDDGCFLIWNYYSNYFHELLVTDGMSRNKYKKEITYYDLNAGVDLIGELEAIIIEYNNDEYTHEPEHLRMGTFNFGVAETDNEEGKAHRIRDVYPYLVWGNSAQDYNDYTPYERFIWDKASHSDVLYAYIAKSLSGSALQDAYEDGNIDDNGGTAIPNEVINTYSVLDTFAPGLTLTVFSIYEDEYSNLDWATRVAVGDDYTDENQIVIVEVEDLVIYYTPGSYDVKLILEDNAKNRQEVTITVNVLEVPGC